MWCKRWWGVCGADTVSVLYWRGRVHMNATDRRRTYTGCVQFRRDPHGYILDVIDLQNITAKVPQLEIRYIVGKGAIIEYTRHKQINMIHFNTDDDLRWFVTKFVSCGGKLSQEVSAQWGSVAGQQETDRREKERERELEQEQREERATSALPSLQAAFSQSHLFPDSKEAEDEMLRRAIEQSEAESGTVEQGGMEWLLLGG
eukprot:TRINITY_DN3197_c0_g2_i1.p1 TRINITY_DN3197_c0_g2~~TRINITY_DN3197_c0_g2_i1.p1  ORF type:complete len:202 (+),score=42.63 TRINITY_DN3197_c0_g2_i1:19-624(+)